MIINNADLDLKLRKVGHATPSFHIDTDEGDGCTIIQKWNCAQDINPELKPDRRHYDEWIGQLEGIVEKLKICRDKEII